MEGTKKIKSMSFHQYSWNSEVETTWISMIGWHHKTSTKYLPRQINVVKKFPSSSLFLGAPCCQKCELWQIAKGIWAKVKPSASVKLSIKLHEKFNFVSRVPLETASHLLVHSSRAKHGKVWKWHSYVSSVYQRVYQSAFINLPIFKSLWENQTRIYFGFIVIL